MDERQHEDSALIENALGSPDVANLGEDAHEVYTNGACWYLAWWLHKLTGHPIGAIGGYDGEILDQLDDDTNPWAGFGWTHIGLLIDDQFLDVDGLHDPDDAMETYLDDEGEEQGIEFVSLDEFAAVVFDPEQMSDTAAAITRRVAELVLENCGLTAVPA